MTKEKEKETWVIPDFDNYEIHKLDDKFLIKKKPKSKNYVVACTLINPFCVCIIIKFIKYIIL